MAVLSPEEQAKQALYRDARIHGHYNLIWQTVNKCAFCDLREKYVFFEENGIVMTVNLYAYIDGNLMIVPRRHVHSVKELTQLEWDTVRKFLYMAKKLIKDVHGIAGMQLVQKDGQVAQSTVEHLHFHCIPFDAPDLSQWNPRKLKYTPLENTSLYRRARKKIINYDTKFEEKYRHVAGLPIVCDAIILNNKQEVLLQKRKAHVQLSPNYLTLPGGRVEDFGHTLEAELAREVQEETGLAIEPAKFELFTSRITSIKLAKSSPHLNLKYAQSSQFLWNTYLLRGLKANTPLTPGDDCQELGWHKLHDVSKSPHISPGIRQTIQALLDKGTG